VTNSDASSTAGGNAAAMAGARTGTPPDMGTAVTGSTLTKLMSAVTAEYPGTVERAMQRSDA